MSRMKILRIEEETHTNLKKLAKEKGIKLEKFGTILLNEAISKELRKKQPTIIY